MKLLHNIKNKKGFGLVECVVALLLFAIVTGSVLTIFSVSRSQIKRQNDQYKIDLMAENILSVYEASNFSDSFKKRMGGLGLTLSGSDSYSQTIGTAGTAQYAFDTQNVPVGVPFSKIVVKDGSAIFRNSADDGDLVGFEGDYPNNKLQDKADYNWKWNSLFNETKKRVPSRMTLSGKAYPALAVMSYDYSIIIDEENVSMKLGSMENYISEPACDFDKYLLKNKYYLKCDYKIETSKAGWPIALPTTYHYRFQVYDSGNNAVKVDGQNLYYCVSVPIANVTISCATDMGKVISGENDNSFYYFNLDNCTIKYYTGSSCPSYSNFKNELTDNGTKFTGKWCFLPWFVYKNDGNIPAKCDKFVAGYDYYEYTPKTEVANNIYYALNTTKNTEILLFNSDGALLFPYGADSTNPLSNLIDNCDYGVDGKRNTRAVYNGDTYDKWYKRGAVPLWDVTKVKFVDGGKNGTSRIIFYGKAQTDKTDSEYISFNYAKENHSGFENDRDTILKFDGNFSHFYNFSKTYNAKSLKNVTDTSGLEKYKTYDKLKNIQFGTSSSEETVLYYAVTGPRDLGRKANPRYEHTFTYYSYKITTTKKVELASYKENSHTLEIKRNGDDITCTETITDSASVKTTYTYAITATAQNKTVTSKDNSKSTPTAVPNEIVNGTKVDSLQKSHKEGFIIKETVIDWDYTDKDWVFENVIKPNKPTTSEDTKTGIVSGSSYNEIPADLDANWTLAATPTDADLHTQATLTSLIRTNNSFDVQIGENIVLTAFPTDFIITAGGVSAGTTDCTYDVVGGEQADIKAETYYITWTSGDVSLVCVATYSNYTREFEVDGVKMKREPKITVWSMPKSEKPSDIKTITDSRYNKYLYRTYRKG